MCIARLTLAAQRLTRDSVSPADLFSQDVIASARAYGAALEPHERDAIIAASGRALAGEARKVLRIRLTPSPGAPGTKRFLAFFGDRLLRVRYRYDDEQRLRLTTVELIVDQRSLQTPTDTAQSIHRAWMVPSRYAHSP